MNAFRQAIFIALSICYGFTINCASEQKRAQEEARIEARAKELAAEIIQQAKSVEQAPAESKQLDERLINPKGTVWWSGVSGGNADPEPSLYIFYKNGRWVYPDLPNNILVSGTWFTKNGRLTMIYFDGTVNVDTTYTVGEYKNKPSRIYLRSQGFKLDLCTPSIPGSCHFVRPSDVYDESYESEDLGDGDWILEMVGGSLENLSKRYE